ncbi:MAG: L,D-transpeptidase [Pyrinomonadaceae bacterium]|nr:L,D-transpeptidase [Pyrinomonadaceae bacterium]
MFQSNVNSLICVCRNGVAILAVLIAALCPVAVSAQRSMAETASDLHESERSDKVTGGRIEGAEFDANEPDIRVTLNVPSFRLTLWQNGKEVKSYFVGVGLKDHPIYIGDREATEIIWNPAWIPPASDWVREMKGVSPGEIIKAGDPRNPLGKLKIPLGDRYLIHQAAKTTDIGNLVSHGCVRMLRSDLFDLAEKIVAARSPEVSAKRIEAAKRSLRTLVVQLEEPVPVDINYDTIVVEGGFLHIYPDVYGRRMNLPARLRDELKSSGIDVSNLDDATIRKMLSKVTRKTQFVADKTSIEQGRALEDGHLIPLIPRMKAMKASKRK